MKRNDLFSKLDSGEVKLYEIENHVAEKSEAIDIRREYIASKLGLDFEYIDKINFNPDQIYKANCENVVGAVSLPVGLAGPMKVNGNFANGEFFTPIATTEGTLVASISRGAKLIHLAGGATTSTHYHGITRAPVFRTSGIRESEEFVEFAKNNLSKLKEVTAETDKFIKLTDFEPVINGRSVWLRFHFDTSDAMGMNMAVKATKSMSDYLESETNVKTIAISGNVCIDKKPSSINTLLGRGRTVTAEVRLSEDICRKYLKSEIEDIVEVGNRKIWQGSTMAGSLGYNSHVANMIAGIFIATGQDPAHTVDASTATTTFEKDGDELYVAVRIPTLNIATVGGGTGLSTQKELLSISLVNILDGKMIEKDRTAAFSEIIGTAVLSGELSLAAAFANNTFVKAHEDLGRPNKL